MIAYLCLARLLQLIQGGEVTLLLLLLLFRELLSEILKSQSPSIFTT